MKAAPVKVLDPLSPEVLAVIRSAFDGYYEADPETKQPSRRRARKV